MSAWRRLAALGGAVVSATALACADVGDPGGPTSLAFSLRQLPAPFLVLRDTLRDTLGNLAPLRALVYDGNDNLLPDAEVVYTVLDTAHVALRPGNYLVSTDTTPLRTVRVQARAGSLVSEPLAITILPALPDTLVNPDTSGEASGLLLFSNGVREATSRALRAQVRRGTTPLGPYFVEFRIVSKPASLDSAWFPRTATDTLARASTVVDTADASGIAERTVRARVASGAPVGIDTLRVRARIRQGTRPTDSVEFRVLVQVK